MENYKTVDLKEWILTGGGVNSDAYTSQDGDYMLKVFKKNATLETAKADFDAPHKVASMGISTPKVYEIVKVGKGYGVLYQNLKNKTSFSRLIADDPERLEEYAKAFAKKTKELHETPCNAVLFESKASLLRKGVEKAKFIGKYKEKLFKVIDDMAVYTTCIHGDLQTGNLVRADGTDYWIDLDRFSYGDPLYDIAHLYSMYMNLSHMKMIQNLLHLTQKQLNRFWYVFACEYFGCTKEALEDLSGKLEIYNCLDLLLKNHTQPGFLNILITLIMVRPKLKKYL